MKRRRRRKRKGERRWGRFQGEGEDEHTGKRKQGHWCQPKLVDGVFFSRFDRK